MTDEELFGASPDDSSGNAAPDGDPAVWTVLGEAGGDPDGQKAVASVIANRAKRLGAGASDIVTDPAQGFEAWNKKADALKKQYPPSSPEYQAALERVQPILEGKQPAPYPYDSYYSPKAQAALGRKPPEWDDGTGVNVGGNLFFAGKYQGAPILSDQDKEDWARLQGGRGIRFKPTAPTSAPGSPAPPDAPATTQADTAKFLKLHGFMMEEAPQGSSQNPVYETADGAAPTTPGTWYVPREGGLRQVGSDVPDYLPAYRRLAATRDTAMAAPLPVRLAIGGGQGGSDVGASVNRLLGGTLGTTPEGQFAGDAYTAPTDQAAAQGYMNARNRYNLVHGDDPAATVGRIGGNMLFSAPMLAAGEGAMGLVGGGMARAFPALAPYIDFAGGASSGNQLMSGLSQATRGAQEGVGATALTSAESDQPVRNQLLHGAALGGVVRGALPVAGAVADRVAGAAPISPEVANLADVAVNKYNIPLRRTQILGVGDRNANVADSEMISRLGTGYAENHAAQREAFARAAARPMGEDAPLTPETMDAARKRIGSVFEDQAQRTGVPVTDQLKTDLAGIQTQARELGLDQSQINALDMQVQKILDQGAIHNGVIPGNVYQTLTENGSSLSRIMRNDHSSFSDLASDIRGALDDAVTNAASPEDVAALREARSQWKALKTVQPLAAKAGPDGYISPTLLRGRVMAQYPDFAFGGGGDLGELARIGQTFMKEPPQSGTAPRIRDMIKRNALTLGGVGLGEGAAGLMHNPGMALKVAGAGALAAGLRGTGNLVSGAYNRASPVVNNLIRRGQTQDGGDVVQGVLGRLGNYASPAYVPLAVSAERNRLFAPQP